MRRRFWWPVTFGTALAVAGLVAPRLPQLVDTRPDPHGDVAAGGGSYRSEHMLAVVVFLGGSLLALWPRVRWWGWAAVAVPAGPIAMALVVTVAHWPSDVLGGGLLALAVLAVASRSRPRRWTHERSATVVPRFP